MATHFLLGIEHLTESQTHKVDDICRQYLRSFLLGIWRVPFSQPHFSLPTNKKHKLNLQHEPFDQQPKQNPLMKFNELSPHYLHTLAKMDRILFLQL